MDTPASSAAQDPADRLVVTHDEARHRYEGRLDGELVALVDYVPRDTDRGTVLAVVHTEVVPEHQGEGLAGALVGAALEDVRRRGLRVQPACSFVRLHVRRHPERYADLL